MKSVVEIRKMVVADIDAVVDVYGKIYNPTYISFSELAAGLAKGPGKVSENAVELFREEVTKLVANAKSGRFIATSDGLLIGFVLASLNPATAGHIECWLDDLGVLPDYQGKRVGRKLVERVFEWGDQESAEYFLLESGMGNEAAHRLFEGVGFEHLSVVLWKGNAK